MIITKEQFKEWNDAITCAQFRNPYSLRLFKEKYPDLFRHMTSMLRKRTKLRTTIEAFRSVSPFVYWGALTWSEEENDLNELSKRKQATRFLDKFFACYVYVEEYGEEEGRYHIHFFGLMSKFYTFDEMYNEWHSRLEIECLKDYQCSKKIKYVTKYAVKDVPRLHMNARAKQLVLDYRQKKKFDSIGFECLTRDYWTKIVDLYDLPF